MGTVCEHQFERPDKDNPKYSDLEYDLYARLGLSIRKNLETGNYELFTIKTGIAQFSYPKLQDAVDKANELEGGKNTEIKCGSFCPKYSERWKK